MSDDRPPLVRRRGKWEARLSVDSSTTLYLGRYRNSWDAERALHHATGSVSALHKPLRTVTTPEPPSSGSMVASRHSRPTSSRSDVERTAPSWLVAPHHRRNGSLILRSTLSKRAGVVHVYSHASHELMLVGRLMGPQKFALYEPSLRPGRPARLWAPDAPGAALDDADFALQRKVGIGVMEGGACRLHLLHRLLKSRASAAVALFAGAGTGLPPPPAIPPSPGDDDVTGVSPHAAAAGDAKWLPILAWSYSLGGGFLSVVAPPLSHAGVPTSVSTRKVVEMREDVSHSAPPPSVRVIGPSVAPGTGTFTPRAPTPLCEPTPRRDSGSFLPGAVWEEEEGEGAGVEGLGALSPATSRAGDAVPSFVFALTPLPPAAVCGLCGCELAACACTPQRRADAAASCPSPPPWLDYRVEFVEPLCALQAAALAIAHLGHTGSLVQPAPLLLPPASDGDPPAPLASPSPPPV